MLNSNLLLCLYNRVLENTSFVNGANEKDMKQAIEHMHKVYQGSPDSLSKDLNCLNSSVDFNEVAYRCAYLFKYAPFHTALAYKAMSHSLTESSCELRAAIDSLSGPLKVCSLGGGPGTDVIGVLAAMHTQFGFFRNSVELVDIMSEWELTFSSILDELRQQDYGSLSESVSEMWLDWSFMRADLQSKMSRELNKIIGTADMVTMVKFVSAAACKETSSMIEKIFRMMKPGAFVFFIDNAAGGFKELITSAAEKYKFNAVSTPLKHQPYINECFNNIKYGYRSCYESKVAVQLLIKSSPIDLSRGPTNHSSDDNMIANWPCNENFPSPVSQWQKIYVPRFQNFRIGPKPVNNLINESLKLPPPSNWHESNFSPSPEFSPGLNRLKAQIDSPVHFYESFESQPFSSSSPHSPNSHNWPATDANQAWNAEYENEIANDSGYSDESFNIELPWDSPANNSSPHLRAPQRLVRYRIPQRKPGPSFHENESFSPQHSMLMPYDDNSLAPIPYRQNLHQLEQSPRMSFKGIGPMYNQSLLISEPPLHQPWSSDRHPFGILQYSERPPSQTHPRICEVQKRPRIVLMHRHKPYMRKRSQTK